MRFPVGNIVSVLATVDNVRCEVALTVTVSRDWKGNQKGKFSLIGLDAAKSKYLIQN